MIVGVTIGFAASSKRTVGWVVWAWIVSAGASAAVAVVDAIGPATIGTALTGVQYLGRPAGLSVHPNHLAITCAMALPIAGWSFSYATGRGARLVSAVFIGILIAGLLVSGSRAGFLGAWGACLRCGPLVAGGRAAPPRS